MAVIGCPIKRGSAETEVLGAEFECELRGDFWAVASDRD